MANKKTDRQRAFIKEIEKSAGFAIGQLQALNYQIRRASRDKTTILNQVKLSEAYKKAGMTWDEFCAKGEEDILL